MIRRCFDGVLSGVLILVLGWPCGAAAQSASGLPKNLVPAQFNTKKDGLGFQWEMNSQGYLKRGTNNCFEVAGHLQVNNSEFYPRNRMMTPDGTQYFLSKSSSGVEITRWIKFDLKGGTVRFVDTYRNPSSAPVTLNVKLMVSFRNSVGAVLTDLGTPPGGTPAAMRAVPGMAMPASNPFGSSSSGSVSVALGKKQSGLVVRQTAPGVPSLLLYLAAARSKVKPVVQRQGNQMFFIYGVTVPPQQTMSILHGMAQRNLGSKTDARSLAKVFKPFKARDWVKDLPDEVRKSLLNYGRTYAGSEAPTGPLLGAVINLAEHYDVERGNADVLVQDESSRLSGMVLGSDVTVQTRYGPSTVALADVAMLLGGAGIDRPMQVHLRNGEILAGPLGWKEMVLETDAGLKVSLNPAQLNVLFLHVEPDDGKPPAGAVVLLGTHLGDRLAVAAEPPAKLQALTAWGPIEVPLAQIDAVHMVRLPQPIHRLVLTDKSRLSAILRGKEISLGTVRFGTVKVSPASVAGVVAAKARPDPDEEGAEDEGEIKVAQCELVGENVLVGRLDAAELQVLTAGGATPLRTGLIRVMEQNEGEEGAGTFTFELADGSQLAGRIPERVVAIRSRGKLWSVPVEHLLVFRQPEGSVEVGGPGAGKPVDPFAFPLETKPAVKPAPEKAPETKPPVVKPAPKKPPASKPPAVEAPKKPPQTKPPAPTVPATKPVPGPARDPFASKPDPTR